MEPNHHSPLHHLKPMLLMYLVIIILTVLKQFIMPMQMHMENGADHNAWNPHMLMNDFMGIMFLVSAAFKLINLKQFAQGYAQYDLIAQRFYAYGFLYPCIELGFGIAYLTSWNLLFINWCVLILMLVNAAGIGYALYQKKQVDSVSMGARFKMPLNYVALIDPILMAAMAVMMIY